MERAPDKLPDTSSRLITMAVSLVGSAEAVVAEIRCSDADFRDYCAAVKEPTQRELDRLLQLIVREQGKMIARNRELLARIRTQQKRTDDR